MHRITLQRAKRNLPDLVKYECIPIDEVDEAYEVWPGEIIPFAFPGKYMVHPWGEILRVDFRNMLIDGWDFVVRPPDGIFLLQNGWIVVKKLDENLTLKKMELFMAPGYCQVYKEEL